jgi:hypothetical protein
MVRVRFPKYLRGGVVTNKSLAEIRAEALAAERWERRAKLRRGLEKVKDFFNLKLRYKKYKAAKLKKARGW